MHWDRVGVLKPMDNGEPEYVYADRANKPYWSPLTRLWYSGSAWTSSVKNLCLVPSAQSRNSLPTLWGFLHDLGISVLSPCVYFPILVTRPVVPSNVVLCW